MDSLQNLDLPGLQIERIDEGPDGSLHAHVRCLSASNPQCPACGAPTRATGAADAHFTEIPRNGRAVVIVLRRRHFRCAGCGRPCHETPEGLHERHRVTERLVGWIRAEGAVRPFTAIAKDCGLSQRTVIKLFRKAMAGVHIGELEREGASIAVASLPLAGELRHLLLDDAGVVIEVFRSTADFEAELRFRAELGNPVNTLVEDPALDRFHDLIRAAFQPERTLANPILAKRFGIELMTQAAREAIAAQAKRERMAARTGEILFARKMREPGRNARRRLNRWEGEAKQLHRAYELKNGFVKLCSVFTLKGWEEWRDGANALAGIDRGDLPTIDYAGVVELFERYADGLATYQTERKEWRACERTLAALAELGPIGTRSFAGARAAVLQRFGARGQGEGQTASAED